VTGCHRCAVSARAQEGEHVPLADLGKLAGLGEEIAGLVDVTGHRAGHRRRRIGRATEHDFLVVVIDGGQVERVESAIDTDEAHPTLLLDRDHLDEEYRGVLRQVIARLEKHRESERPQVARDALRTLEALGIVEIRMGKGGGARIARGNPRLFAEALAVQLDLTGVSASEIMDAQRAIETLGAELAAENATDADIAKLRALLRQAEESIGDLDTFTRLSRDFHLAVAEASHNRVLVVQLISLEHVSWPRRNVTATPKLARHILEIHTRLTDLIELRDAAGARALMDDHVKMIRARRVAERDRGDKTTCC